MNEVLKSNKTKILAIACLVSLVLALIPAISFAVDYPGAEVYDATGTTAQTAVGLKTDESQLSFTAPSVINFALKPDGTFISPTSENTYIKNNSLMDIKVKSFTVNSKSGAIGVADVSGATQANTYQINVKGNTATLFPFAVSSTGSFDGWIVGKAGSTTEKCSLTFTDGKMLNPTGSIWYNGAALQEVEWTVTTNVG